MKLWILQGVVCIMVSLAVAQTQTPTTDAIEWFWGEVAEAAKCKTITPRTTTADASKGEGILESFGTLYMPNAYAHYEKVRAKAIEQEQILKENFPHGIDWHTATEIRNLYNKVSKMTTKAVSEYFRRRDELCHFYLMHKVGAITSAELSKLDSSIICVMLPWDGKLPETPFLPKIPSQTEFDFARKYTPETFSAYERLKNLFDDGMKTYNDLRTDVLVLDAVRGGFVLEPLCLYLQKIRDRLNEIAKSINEQNLFYAVGEMTSEQLAEKDLKYGVTIRAFEKKLLSVNYMKDWLAKNWTVREWAAVWYLNTHLMVPIPGSDYAICKYEVTQALWYAVMGYHHFSLSAEGANLPVKISWYECQEFLKKLNSIPEVKAVGRTYRLPTVEEWQFACRAGARGQYCRLANGAEITRDTLGEVAWYFDNTRGHGPCPVGYKRPNAFGLYDMLGNVWEWTQTANGESRFYCGGDYCSLVTAFSPRISKRPGQENYGFRLCISRRKQLSR